jgi:hypothetical protein
MATLTPPATTTRSSSLSLYLLAAGGFAGIYDMASRPVPFGSGFEMVALAQNLARTGSFANPFSILATGPSAANPPLYPLLLALLFKIFTSVTLVAFAATLATILANALTATFLPRVSEIFFGDFRPGAVAAVLWILAVPVWPCWDVSFTVLALILFCLETQSASERQRPGFSAFTSGLLASALFLFNPSTILVAIPWMAWYAFRQRRSPKRSIAYFGVVVAMMVVTASGWAIRNHEELGKAVIRTNLGIALNTSNNDCANASLRKSEADNCYQTRNPNTSMEEAMRVRVLGEVAYDRMRVHDSRVWIESHHRKFLKLTLARVRDFWFPVPEPSLTKCAVVWIATVLSIPGLLMMIRRRMAIASFLCAVFFVYPLMYYIVVSDVRYRLPILWLTLLPCGWFLVELWDRLPASSSRHSGKTGISTTA